MKKITLLIILLLTAMMAGAESKSVEIEMVATAYVEPHGTDVTVDGSGVGLSGQVLRLGSITDYEDLKGLVYFKFNNTGKAKFELLIQNGRADRQISVEFNGLKRELAIPHTNGDYQWITVLEGDVKGQPNYSYITIRNITKGRLNFQKLRITADSKVIEGVSYNTNTGSIRDRMAPYLLLYYDAGSGIESFYNEATVFDGCDLIGTYFAALDWSGLAEGYAGLEVDDIRLNVPVKGDKNALMYALWNTNLRNDTEVEYQAIPYKLSNEAT
jgi:hypothetical protein